MDKEHPYGMINLEALYELLSIDEKIKPSTVKLWLYFANNQDHFQLQLSPTVIQRKIGISESTYKRAKADLIAKNYLRETDDGNWEFYDKQVKKWDF